MLTNAHSVVVRTGCRCTTTSILWLYLARALLCPAPQLCNQVPQARQYRQALLQNRHLSRRLSQLRRRAHRCLSHLVLHLRRPPLIHTSLHRLPREEIMFGALDGYRLLLMGIQDHSSASMGSGLTLRSLSTWEIQLSSLSQITL